MSKLKKAKNETNTTATQDRTQTKQLIEANKANEETRQGRTERHLSTGARS